MADVQKNTNSAVAWIAIIAVAIALPIAIVAFNRSGEDLDDTVRDQTEIIVQDADRTIDEYGMELNEAREELMETAAQVQVRAELEAKLMAIRAQVAANEASEETVADVQSLRTDLVNAYSDAVGALRTEVDSIDQDLARLEAEVTQDAATALATIDNIVDRLQGDALIDEDDSMNDGN